MSIFLNIFSVENLIQADDTVLCIMTLLFFMFCLQMGPNRSVYVYAVSSMFRFRSPDSDVQYPTYKPAGTVFLSLISSLGMAFLVATSFKVKFTDSVLLGLLILWGYFIFFMILKILLYQAVSIWLFNTQSISLKPIRWRGFFIMVFSVAGLFSLVLSAFAVFFSLPRIVMVICGLLLLVFMEAGLIFKLKTALFRNKCSNLFFFLYLCALEIGPVLAIAVLLGKTVS